MSIDRFDGFYLVSIKVGAASICMNKKIKVWKRGTEGRPRFYPEEHG
jgi:hypothetical protein